MNGLCDCIIPFYNEEKRIVPVLNEITKIKNISQIICVDDGSTDNTSLVITHTFPQITLVRLKKNQGQSHAIKAGLRHAKTNTILLIDADLQGLRSSEVTNAITKMKNTAIDMIILRRMHAPTFLKLNRSDIIISGERILRKRDLANILSFPVKKFQYVIAINKYMMNMKKKVYWIPSSARNTFKIKKFPLLHAITREYHAYEDFFSYAGVSEYIEQVAFFCHEKAR